MSTATMKNILPGQTSEGVHVKLYAQDNANTISQIVDTTTPLVVSVQAMYSGIISASVDPNDNRRVIGTRVGPGTGFISVQTNPPMATPLQLQVTVVAPPPDNRRCDFVAADDPT